MTFAYQSMTGKTLFTKNVGAYYSMANIGFGAEALNTCGISSEDADIM